MGRFCGRRPARQASSRSQVRIPPAIGAGPGADSIMTMLDRMRRHKGWLKWSLGLVVLAFIVFYIPNFLRTEPTRRRRPETVATVGGEPITVGERFRRAYQSAAAGLSAGLRREPERAAAQAARHRPADPPADDRRAGGARRGRAPRHSVSDEEVRAADLCDPGVPGERRSSSASSATSSCCRMQKPPMTTSRVRGQAAPRARSSTSCAPRSPTGSRCSDTDVERGVSGGATRR